MTTDASDRPWNVRTLDDSDWEAFVALASHAFGQTEPAAAVEAERRLMEPGRSIGAHEGKRLVGIATAYSLSLTVPGGVVPAAGISWVGVLPTHRRRGALSALMDHQLAAVHDAGREPVAVLWASEPPIYGRYDYGPASRKLSLEVPRSASALGPDAPHDPALRLRIVDADDWLITAPVHDRVAATRPGMFARDDRWWAGATHDDPELRDGRSALRCVVAEDDQGARGYARYATKQRFDEGFGQGLVTVREVIAADAAALAGLYRYLFDLDLMDRTELRNLPVDDPLLLWLNNIRRTRPVLGDALYVRLVDLPAALTSRTYALPLDVVLAVSDPRCPWNDGTWRLTSGPDGATCRLSKDEPDLHLGVRELGAAYLGGTSLAELAAAGLVTGNTATVQAVSRAFLSTPAPWCPVIF